MTVESNYSPIDRILHRLSFLSIDMQIEMAPWEDRLFKSHRNSSKPVFITGLPRSGTTLLLELVLKSDEFATHCYRDMPFLLLPQAWNYLTKNFRRPRELKERAHRDGMFISPDSAEAFEEVIWKAFWPDQYREREILPWQNSVNKRFDEYFGAHTNKIIEIRQKDKLRGRYLSKNNANISRLNYILSSIPDALVVIPFRDPVNHAASLLNQHKNFLELQKQNKFGRRFMSDIGHFEFGLDFKPINFNNWLSTTPYSDPLTLNFWLQYWIATYTYLFDFAGPRVLFFNYDALCEDPNSCLEKLGEFLVVADRASLQNGASLVQSRRLSTNADLECDGKLIGYAQELWAKLKDVNA